MLPGWRARARERRHDNAMRQGEWAELVGLKQRVGGRSLRGFGRRNGISAFVHALLLAVIGAGLKRRARLLMGSS